MSSFLLWAIVSVGIYTFVRILADQFGGLK